MQLLEKTAAAASSCDLVFFGIVNGLEAQTIVPAQRLVESDLAATFGVGRNSVREALQRLAAEGIIELHRNRGAIVRSLTVEDTLDVLDVAQRMTGLLARAAARNSSREPQRKELSTSLSELSSARAGREAAVFATARRHFYRALLEMGQNRELRRLFPSIQMPIVYAQHKLPGLQKMRQADYRRIGTAVLAGKLEEADEAGQDHVRHVRDEILARIALETAQSR